MLDKFNPIYTGNQWYTPTSSTQLYNPKIKVDVDSRQIWYDNITFPDMVADMKFRRRVAMKKYRFMNSKELQLFLTTRPPEYH
jgi:hypothetical protein